MVSLRKIVNAGLLLLMVIFILVWTLGPFTWLILSSLQTNHDLISLPWNLLPKPVTLDNYRQLLLGQYGQAGVATPSQQYREALRNSLVIAGSTTVICATIGVLGGYAFSRFNFKFKNTIFLLTLTMQMFPFVAVVIPLYLIIVRIGLRDNVLSLIMIDSAFISPYVVWIMRNFFAAIPTELEDAARIDGAGRLRALFSVILPLAAPGVVAAAVYSFLAAWNDFFAGLIFTSTIRSKPATVLMTQFTTRSNADMGLMTTGGVLAAIPPVVLALIFQRWLVRGLTAGAVKQ
jgi:multiple sugar transport system permease protein